MTAPPELFANLKARDGLTLLAAQLGLANYLETPVRARASAKRSYTSNEEVWRDIIGEQVRAGARATLDHFFLSEWLLFAVSYSE